MNRIRKIKWIGWTLVIIAGLIFCIDISSGHFETSNSLFIFAIILGAFGLGLYTWVNTTPGESLLLIRPRKGPLTSIVFWGTMAALASVLVWLTFFDTQHSWRKNLRSAVFSIVLLFTYGSLVTLIRYLRSRQDPADIYKQPRDSRL